MINFKELNNKKIIVTGSSTGIGFETAIEFLNLNAKVIFHGNNSIKDLEKKIKNKSKSNKFHIIQSDFSDINNVQKFIEEAVTFLGGLDVLVNNAGTMIGRYNLLDIQNKDFDKIFDLNAKSVFFLIKHSLQEFKKNKEGCIINVSTISARSGGSVGSSVYASSKAFVSSLTRSLVSELSPLNIRINAISPGTIDTKFHQQYSTKEKLEKTKNLIPMKRLGNSFDCVGPIIFLSMKSLSGYITGQVIEVNGGQFFN